jgi:hypothetical protein
MKTQPFLLALIIFISFTLFSCKKEYKCDCIYTTIDYPSGVVNNEVHTLVYKERKKELAKRYCGERGITCHLQE